MPLLDGVTCRFRIYPGAPNNRPYAGGRRDSGYDSCVDQDTPQKQITLRTKENLAQPGNRKSPIQNPKSDGAQRHNILNVRRMRKHIDGLDGINLIHVMQALKVAHLRLRIATDVHEALGA